MATSPVDRRRFLLSSTGLLAGLPLLTTVAEAHVDPVTSPNIIGPMDGYTPQVGTLLSMLNWMNRSTLGLTKNLTQSNLDFLFDDKSNTIGAMLMHLAATEVIYQDTTLNGLADFSPANKAKWDMAMNLGAEARNQIKGNSLDYYLNALNEVRAKTTEEFKKRDDAWLAVVDNNFWKYPTNNYCKWFHVAEHIGNHRGQITWIAKRLPGAKVSKD